MMVISPPLSITPDAGTPLHIWFATFVLDHWIKNVLTSPSELGLGNRVDREGHLDCPDDSVELSLRWCNCDVALHEIFASQLVCFCPLTFTFFQVSLRYTGGRLKGACWSKPQRLQGSLPHPLC